MTSEDWSAFDGGVSPGTPGSECGTIIRDEEHSWGARINLERDSRISPFAITCGIYGSMVHTRFLGSESEATTAYKAMKLRLVEIMKAQPLATDPEPDFGPSQIAMERFLADFP